MGAPGTLTDCGDTNGRCVNPNACQTVGKDKDKECVIPASQLPAYAPAQQDESRCLYAPSQASQFITCAKDYDAKVNWDVDGKQCYAFCHKKKNNMMEYIRIAAFFGGAILVLIILFVTMYKRRSAPT